jgi:ABC-type transporter MlaC component
MNSSFKFFIFLLIMVCTDACSHSTATRFNHENVDAINFTIENKDFLKKANPNKLHFHITRNMDINVDIKSIADYVQPIVIDQSKKYWPDDYDLQPWAFCSIYF